MSSLPNGLTFQVILTPPTGGNVSALRQQIQAGLGNIQANVQLNNAATANKQLNAISASTKKSTKDTKDFGDAIGIAGRNFAAYTSAVAILGRISIALSRATRDAIKFEREFVKLAQVFDTNVKNLEGLSNKISELSQQYGLSANVIAKTSVVLAQSGLTARETQIALNSLAKTTLASTFDNIAQTAEGAVAIIAQFEEGVGSLESQLGAINAVSKKFAVESNDIIEAVRRGGGAFKAANGTFNEFISLFTAVRSTTRESAETISTGFRTIFARLQRPKVIDYFKELNIQLEDGQGNFVGAFEAVKRLSEGLDRAGIKAGQIKFAEVVEQLGGIRQVSRVIPLLGQFKKAEEARQVALAGGVSLDKDVAKAQETTAQAIERTRQNFAALIREISQTQSFKEIVKIALSMANAFLEIARTLKPLIPLIAVLGSIKLGGLFSTAVKTGFTTPGLGTKRPFAKGGTVLGFNRGGSVPGTGNGDTVPAMLEPGEFVIRKSAVQAFGADKLAGINKYTVGGQVSATGEEINRLYKNIPTDPERIYSGVIIPNKYSTKSNTLMARMIAAGRRNPQYPATTKTWELFEDAVAASARLKQDKTPSAFLDYPLKPGDAKFLKEDKTYSVDDNRGNNNITYLAKTIGAGEYKDNVNIGAYFASNPSQIAAVVKNYTIGKNKDTKKYGNINISKFAKGGAVGSDTVPALLTPGEFVINKKSAEAYGYGNLKKINKYAKGGPVGVQKFADGGEVGGFGGFDFITSAAAEFGVLLFSLKQISGSLKQFQDGLSKSGGAINKEIESRRQEIRARTEVSEILKKKIDQIVIEKEELKNQSSAAAGAVEQAGAKTQDVRSNSAVLDRLVSGAKASIGPSVKTSPAALDEAKKLAESYKQLEGANGPVLTNLKILKESLQAYNVSADVIVQEQIKYLNSVSKADQAFEQSQQAVVDLSVQSSLLADSQARAEEQFRKLNQSIPSKAFDSVKKGLLKLVNSADKAASKILDIGTEVYLNPRRAAQSVGQKIASGTKAVGERIGAGARVGVKKVGAGIRRAGQAAADNPLAVVAGVAASLRTVLGGVAKTYSDLAEQAIANGDAEEAASSAKLAAEFKAVNDFTTASVGAGAAIGSAFGPVGTIIGSFAGALVGALSTFKPFQDAIDVAIGYLNLLPGVDIETFAGSIEKAEKAARDAANRNKLEKEIEAIGTKFRNLGRDIDPKTNLAGFVSAADELAKVTNQQAASIKSNPILKEDGTIDEDEQARRLAENSKAAADAFAAASEAANAQGISLQKLAQDSPELAKAFKATLPPGEAESIWNQMIQVNQAAIAAIASENAARQRGISIFLAQLSIQVRLNASLEAFDAALSRQKDSLANLDFAISGSVGKKEIGSNLTDFDSSGTAKFAEGLRAVSRLGPDFANQANQIQGVLGAFNGFAQSLAGGDLQKVSSDISRRLSGILSNEQITQIQKEISESDFKGDPAAAKALEKKLIEDAIGPFAETLERGRQQINESLDNYSELLEKRNTIEQRIYDRRVESLKLEQDIKNKIAEIRGDDPSLFQAGADRTARGRNALAGTGLGGSLTGNAAKDVSLVANELAINKNAQKLLQQNINSGRLNLQQQKSARSALQDLGLEADKLENSMQLLSDTTQETAILQKKLDESREGRRQKGELATELAFGTKESRFNFQQTLGLTKLAVQSGSAEVIPEEKRGDVLSLLKRFEKLPVFGGRTGAEVIKNLTGNFLRNQGFNESQIDEVLADMVPTEEKILKQIENNLTVDEIRNKYLRRIADKLDGDVLAANPKSTGGPIYASTGKLVNYQPKGTDTVPAMLTPGEFVIKKSSVDKYGAGMLSAINAGNYATGGVVKPKYLAAGSRSRILSKEELLEKERADFERERQARKGKFIQQANKEKYGLSEAQRNNPPQEEQKAFLGNKYTINAQRRKNQGLSNQERDAKIKADQERMDKSRELYGQPESPGLIQAKRNKEREKETQRILADMKAKHQIDLAEDKKRRSALTNTQEINSGGRPTENSMHETEAKKNEEARNAAKEASSKRQNTAFDANLGKGPKPNYAMSARQLAELYNKNKMAAETAKPVTDGTNKAGTPADAEAPSTDIFRTILERGFGIGVEVKKTANETPEQKSETPQQRRERISKQIEDRKRRMDEAKAKKAEAFSGNNEPSISGSSNYPSNPEGIYHIKQAFNAPNLAKFLKSNLGSDALPYIKAYKDAGVNPTKISGSKLSIFKESEAQLILTGNPISDSLTLSGNFTKNPKLSVLSQDEKLFFLWAKNGKIKDVEDARQPENISYFKKNLSKIRANFLDYGFQSNPPSLGKDHRDPVGYLNNGGPVGGVPGVDANPAMLTRGEYVINKKSAEAIGTNNLNRLNSIKGYNKGGRVGYYADGGSVGGLGNSSESYTMFSNSVDKLVGNNGFAMFKESVDQFNSIPKELTLTVAPTQVTVTLNGAELLSRMTPMIKSQIFEGITSEINKLKEDLKSGNIV